MASFADLDMSEFPDTEVWDDFMNPFDEVLPLPSVEPTVEGLRHFAESTNPAVEEPSLRTTLLAFSKPVTVIDFEPVAVVGFDPDRIPWRSSSCPIQTGRSGWSDTANTINPSTEPPTKALTKPSAEAPTSPSAEAPAEPSTARSGKAIPCAKGGTITEPQGLNTSLDATESISSDAGEQVSTSGENELLVFQEDPSVQHLVSELRGRDKMNLTIPIPETLEISQKHDNTGMRSPVRGRDRTPPTNRPSPVNSHSKPSSVRRSSSTCQSAIGSREQPIVIDDEKLDIAMPDHAYGGDTVLNSPKQDTLTPNKNTKEPVQDILRYPTKRTRATFEDPLNEYRNGIASPSKRTRRTCEDQCNENRKGMVSWLEVKQRDWERVRRRQKAVLESLTEVRRLAAFKEVCSAKERFLVYLSIMTRADIVRTEKAYKSVLSKVLNRIKSKTYRKMIVSLRDQLKRLREDVEEFAVEWEEDWRL